MLVSYGCDTLCESLLHLKTLALRNLEDTSKDTIQAARDRKTCRTRCSGAVVLPLHLNKDGTSYR